LGYQYQQLDPFGQRIQTDIELVCVCDRSLRLRGISKRTSAKIAVSGFVRPDGTGKTTCLKEVTRGFCSSTSTKSTDSTICSENGTKKKVRVSGCCPSFDSLNFIQGIQKWIDYKGFTSLIFWYSNKLLIRQNLAV
jgi:hypothetical protein